MIAKILAIGATVLTGIVAGANEASVWRPPQETDRAQTQPAQRLAPDGTGFEAKVLGVRISRALPERLRNVSMASGFIAQGRGAGAQILLSIESKSGRILEADPRELRIDEFLDDTQRDLRPRADIGDNYYGPAVGVAADGSTAVAFLVTDREPDEKAERLLVRGSIRLKIAGDEKESEKIDVPLRVGQSLKVGETTLTITGLSLVSGSGAQGVNVSFQSRGGVEAISKVTGFDENGQPLNVAIGNRNVSARPEVPSQLVLHIGTAVERVQLQFTYAKQVRDQVVPFEAQVDLGVARVRKMPDEELNAAREKEQPETRQAPPEPQGDGQRRPAVWPEPMEPGKFPERQEARWPEEGERDAIAAEDAGPQLQGARVQPLSVAASGSPEHDRPVGIETTTDPNSGVPVTRPASGWPVNPALLFQPFGGTQLQLLISVPNERLAGLDLRGIRIDNFSDDTGAQLSTELAVTATPPAPFRSLDEPIAPLAAYVLRLDGREALLRLGLKESPTRGAQQIRVRGSIPALLAGPLQRVESQLVDLRPGSELAPEGAGFTAVVRSVSSAPPTPAPPVAGPPPQAGAWLLLTVQSDLPPERLQSVRMVTENDEPLASTLQSHQSVSAASGQSRTHYYQLHVSTKADRVKVQWEFLGESKPGVVPFDIVVGVGL